MKNCLWVLLLVMEVQGLQGQEKTTVDSARLLKEIVVSYQAGQYTPVSFQNISRETIRAKNLGQEPSFLLSETPSITNYSDACSSQGYSYFRMRGIDQTRVNTSLDGVPMNEPEDQGAYFANQPDLFSSISRVQIQRGVGTSQNGVASYAGSVQLFSPNLTDSNYAAIGGGYGAFNSWRLYGEYNSGLRNRKGLYARVSGLGSDGYKAHAGNQSQSAFLRTGYYGDRSTWLMNALIGRQRNQLAWIGVTDSLIAKDRRTNANTREENDLFLQMMLQVQHRYRINEKTGWQTAVYYTHLNGNYGLDLNNLLGFPSNGELYNYAFLSNWVGLYSNINYNAGNWRLTGGIHGNSYQRRHTGSERTAGRLYQNTGYKKEFSAFAKAEYQLNKLTFFSDIQYRYTEFRYGGSVNMPILNWQFFNPRLGLSAAINPDLVAYYSVGRTGREPTRNDLFGGNDDLLADSAGNPLLMINSAESVVDQELGVRGRWQQWQWSLNAYYMSFNNEIVLNGKFGPNGLALTNKVDNSYRAGLELFARYQLNRQLSFTNQSSFNHSRIQEKSIHFTPILTPALVINQEVQYNLGAWVFALTGRYQSRAYMDFANSALLSSYFLFNARAGFTVKNWTCSVFANNLTNAKYFNYGYVDFDGSRKYFVQAPMHLVTSIRYSL